MIREEKFTVEQMCPHCKKDTYIIFELLYDDDNPIIGYGTLPVNNECIVPNKVKIYCSSCGKDV